jgi:hypothetical protein
MPSPLGLVPVYTGTELLFGAKFFGRNRVTHAQHAHSFNRRVMRRRARMGARKCKINTLVASNS